MPVDSVATNSTNVRTRHAIPAPRIAQETGRVLFAGVAVWATVVAAAAMEGVADKFGDGTLGALGAAISLFAVATYRIDAELRAFARGMRVRILTLAASLGLAIALAAFAVHATVLALFAAPLAAFALAARADRGFAAESPTRASAKSPGARQGAT